MMSWQKYLVAIACWATTHAMFQRCVPSGKVREALWRGFVFASSIVVSLVLFWREPSLLDPATFFNEWPRSPAMSPLQSFYSHAMGGFYAYDLLLLLLQRDFQRHDAGELIAHHIVACLFVYFSNEIGVHRGAPIVIFLHDVADPFLYAAKVALYSGRQRCADALVLLYAVVFALALNVVYTFWLVPQFYRHAPILSNVMRQSFASMLWSLAALHLWDSTKTFALLRRRWNSYKVTTAGVKVKAA